MFSFLVIAGALVGLAVTATTAEQFSLASVGLIIMLLLGVRGTQSERPWDSLAASGWAKQLASAFEPPSTADERASEQRETED
jgi:hypothetical protein